jgi:hypothetical protein
LKTGKPITRSHIITVPLTQQVIDRVEQLAKHDGFRPQYKPTIRTYSLPAGVDDDDNNTEETNNEEIENVDNEEDDEMNETVIEIENNIDDDNEVCEEDNNEIDAEEVKDTPPLITQHHETEENDNELDENENEIEPEDPVLIPPLCAGVEGFQNQDKCWSQVSRAKHTSQKH